MIQNSNEQSPTTRRNAPCPCGSGKRYKHCCGAVVTKPAEPHSDRIAAPHPITIVTKQTFIVLGCPRGGTSLIAGALHHAGVYMGEFRTNQYEDPEFKIPPKEAGGAANKLTEVIRSRNERHEYWGWKVPNNIYYIGNILHLLHNPVFLFIYRDPLEIARSSAKHDRRDWDKEGQKLQEIAASHTRKVREFQASLQHTHHVFELADIHSDPVKFVSSLTDILQSLQPDRDRLLQFVNPLGGYR